MNENAQKIHRWFEILPTKPDTKVVSGQHCGGGALSRDISKYLDDVHTDTGEWIGLVGFDFGWMDDQHATDWPDAKPLLIDLWNKKHLLTACWHMPNPHSGDYNDLTPVDFVNLITPDTPLNTAWMRQVREKADWLSELRDAGVVVIWRPFMEMNMRVGWWKNQPHGAFIAAWRYMHNYMTTQRGLDNLIWLYSPGATTGGQDKLDYYPGASFVDMTGPSKYTGESPMSDLVYQGYPELLSLGHPFCLAECGPGTGSVPPSTFTYNYGRMIQDIRAHCPQAVYFMSWFKTYSMRYQLNARGCLKDRWTINRDGINWDVELPPDQPDWQVLESLERQRAQKHDELAIISVQIADEYGKVNL